MDRVDVEQALRAVFQELSAQEHERWAHWQRYIHQRGELQPDGSIVLPVALINHWERLIKTPYSELTEEEKNSDREQVRRYIPILLDAICPDKRYGSN